MESKNLFAQHDKQYYTRDEHSSLQQNGHNQGIAPQFDTLEWLFYTR